MHEVLKRLGRGSPFGFYFWESQFVETLDVNSTEFSSKRCFNDDEKKKEDLSLGVLETLVVPPRMQKQTTCPSKTVSPSKSQILTWLTTIRSTRLLKLTRYWNWVFCYVMPVLHKKIFLCAWFHLYGFILFCSTMSKRSCVPVEARNVNMLLTCSSKAGFRILNGCAKVWLWNGHVRLEVFQQLHRYSKLGCIQKYLSHLIVG